MRWQCQASVASCCTNTVAVTCQMHCWNVIICKARQQRHPLHVIAGMKGCSDLSWSMCHMFMGSHVIAPLVSSSDLGLEARFSTFSGGASCC